MSIPTDHETAGYTAFTTHRGTPPLQGHAPAENMDGKTAIRFHHAPEDQGETKMMMQRPHDAWRRDWMKGWDRARANFLAGKVEVTT